MMYRILTYKVVFFRVRALPIDIHFGVDKESRITDIITATEYFEERSFVLQDMFDVVIRELNLSKLKMMRQYNKNLRFNDYQKGDEVWLKVKYYKTGENRKLAPRRGGPWTVIEKLPNGVNFRIRNKSSAETKIVHHDRLSPVRSGEKDALVPQSRRGVEEPVLHDDTESSNTENSGDTSDDTSDWDVDRESVQSSSSSESDSDDEDGGVRYTQRERAARSIPGAIPWSAVPKL